MDKNSVIIPVIEYYLGFKIESLDNIDSIFLFYSENGNGVVYQNYIGNWELYIGDVKISEIENIVFNTIMECSETCDVQKYYNKLTLLLKEDLNDQSNTLIKDVKRSLEYFVIREDVKITGNAFLNMGDSFIFSIDGKKQIACLN